MEKNILWQAYENSKHKDTHCDYVVFWLKIVRAPKIIAYSCFAMGTTNIKQEKKRAAAVAAA